MRARAQWVLYFAAVVCSILAILGGVSYPLSSAGLLYVVSYELGILFGTFGILFLIRQKALPES